MRLHLVLVLVAAWPNLGRADVISYLRFEDNGGGIAQDQTGLMDGELINFSDTSPGGGDVSGRGWSLDVPTTTVPLTGDANTSSIRMNGGSGYIDLSNGYDLNLGMDFTIEFYMKPDQPIVASAVFGFEPVNKLFFALIVDVGELEWYTQFQDELRTAPVDLVQIGEWQHVALVMEPTEYTIFIDGQTQYNGPIPSSGQGPFDFPGDPTLGTRTIGGDSGTFRGYLDEFRISDEALTPDRFLMAVPEPTTLGLLGIGAGWILVQTLRRRRQSST
ncbi:MAG: PEP-CTERM sorting domain-containing protein [Spartobacteria bacterium]|nr:PEP-CTERM sorting domain-containing protein [Spartobacteria bacterium]